MTCVLGVETPNGVWLGSDSYLGSDEDWRDGLDGPKWFDWGGARFAYSGALRPAQLIARASAPRRPRGDEDDGAYLARLIETARRVHKAHDVVRRDMDLSWLLAYRGRLYMVMDDYALVRSAHGYAACGAGEKYALGALAATAKAGLDPATRVRRALAAAARHSNSVAEPFYVEQVR